MRPPSAPASFDELRALLRELPSADASSIAACQDREGQLTKPAGSLGRLEDVTGWLCGWQRRHPPQSENLRVCLFAANHGVTRHGISAYPAEVTAQMVENFRRGGAAINQLAGLSRR